jgi:[acyl-carrier-protein] S-malonyltransferase
VLQIDIFEPTADKALVRLAACLLAGLAAVERLRAESGLAAVQAACSCVGHGAGEYAALVFSGAINFDDALRVLMVGTNEV